MITLAMLLRRLRYLLFRDQATAELEEEMRLHRDLRAEALQQQGQPETEARREASRRFGNLLRNVEQSRDTWGWNGIDAFRQDVRYAARRLGQRPGFTLSVVVILTLGIGATTAVFSAVDAAFLRPLPFPRSGELLTLTNVNIPTELGRARSDEKVRSFDIDHVRDMDAVFSHVASYASGGLNLTDSERPRRVNAGVVSGDFFATLNVPAVRGRSLLPSDAARDAPRVVVLSWNLWQREFGGSEVIGRTIPLNTSRHEIVGVMPQGFTFPAASDLWIPMSIPTTAATFEPFRGYLPTTVVARTAPGVTPAFAESQLREAWERVVSNLRREPGEEPSAEETLKEVLSVGASTPLRDALVGERRTALLVLFAATALLLLIACANVTNLLLSYGASRARELAVRTVLGASRGRILRQLLAESVMLSVCGAAIGIALAPVILTVLRTMMPAQLLEVAPLGLDLRVLAFATVLALVTGVLFGLWPAFGAVRASATGGIKAGSGHGSTASGSRRVQRALVAAEIAIAGLLLTGAGLMLRSFERLVATDLGMAADQVATLEMSFTQGTPRATRLERLDAILSELRRLPSVSAAGAVNDLPLRGQGGIGISVHVDGAPSAALSTFPRYLVASDGYFEALGIPLRKGRYFKSADGTGTSGVAVINASMAETFWPGADPIGRTILFGGEPPPVQVVGVVADVREAGLEKDPGPQMYFPARQNLGVNLALVVRGKAPPEVLLASMTQAVRRVDPAQPVYNVRMMDEVIGASRSSRRANTLLISLFGTLALIIAALGVYAVTANAVAQRSREFGIRAALGATRSELFRQVTREGLFVIVIGVAGGGVLAWAAARVMTGLVYDVSVYDVGTFVTAPIVLIATAMAATIFPARRAMRVEPAEVMRDE